MEKKKNKSKVYKLLTSTITINYVDQAFSQGEYVYGYQQHRVGEIKIEISTKDEEGKPLTKEFIESTLRHELFHVILGMLFMDDVNTETTVEWLANATLMLNKQGLTI